MYFIFMITDIYELMVCNFHHAVTSGEQALGQLHINFEFGKKSIFHQSVKIWNNIPNNINPNLPDPVNFVPFGTMTYSPFDINLMSIT